MEKKHILLLILFIQPRNNIENDIKTESTRTLSNFDFQ